MSYHYNLRPTAHRRKKTPTTLGSIAAAKLNYPLPEEENEEEPLLGDYNKTIHHIISQSWSAIRTHYYVNKVYSIYNFRIPQFFTYRTFADYLWAVFYHQKKSFKINIGFSYILQSIPEKKQSKHRKKQYRFFTCDLDAPNLLDEPFPILKGRVDQMLECIESVFILNPLVEIYRKRESTKWELNTVISLNIIVYYFK
jgi:hypothetical protein